MNGTVDRERVQALFYCEANEELGLGHLSRCRSLAAALTGQCRCRIIMACSCPDIAEPFLKGLDCTWATPPEIPLQRPYDLIVTDVPGMPVTTQAELKGFCKLLAGIDDDGPGPFGFDILIRPNILDIPRPPMLYEHAAVWAGSDYIILHPSFAAVSPKRTHSRNIRDIFACFGGSDPQRLTVKLVSVLKNTAGRFRVHLILGHGFSHTEAVEDAVNDDERFRILRNVSHMAELMNGVDAAIISGGTLLYETCALGIPAVVLCQNREQLQEARLFERRGAILNPGLGVSVSDETLKDCIERIFTNCTLRQELSRNALKMVPRDAANSIVRQLLERIQSPKRSLNR